MPSTTHDRTPTGQPARRSRRSAAAPVLASLAVVAVLATAVMARTWGGPDGDGPASAPASAETGTSTSPAASAGGPKTAHEAPVADLPVAVALDLYVGGEQVPGRWYAAQGRGTHWLGLRYDGTWWWSFDAQPQRLDGEIDQAPVISPGGGYLAYVLTGPDDGWTLVGADTEWAGEGFGAVDLPRGPMDPSPRAVAVTDDGLVVAEGPSFQWLWRPLADGATVDLAETAPGQVVLGSTDAGLVVNEGAYGRTDGSQGAPYLARLSGEGVLTRLDPLPMHDVVEATEQWVAYVPPGTVGAEASGTAELQVQRRDGSGAGVLTAPVDWLFVAPGFRWESADRLLTLLVTRDGQTEGLARCRPDTRSCELVHQAG